MRSKKTYIIILIVLIVYFLVFFFLFGKKNIDQEKYSTTFVIGDSTVWNYSGKKWVNITSETSMAKLDWQKFDVYVDNQKLGNYYLWHDDKWYAFNDNKEAITITGKMLAYKSNHEIKIQEYKEEEITDFSYVHQVLKENNLSTSSILTTSNQSTIDIDNDGIEEKLYLISNVFALDFVPDTVFSIVFMVKDGEIKYLYKDISKNTGFNGCKPYINYVLDTNNDNKNEIILSCGKYSDQKTVDMLYKYTEGEFKIAISNQ